VNSGESYLKNRMFTLKKIINKFQFYFQSFLNFFRLGKIFLISDKNNWVIKTIVKEINKNTSIKTSISSSPLFLKNKIIHFGSIHDFIFHKEKVHPSNKIIASWYHINGRNIEKGLAKEIREKNIPIHTSCSITKKGLINLGIKEKQIKVIPLGIDLKIFKPLKNPLEKTEIKKRLGLPLDKIIIGSFQKDGNGWKEGNEPKLIKGPDIFCDTIEILAKKYPLHILLTGPARGYVKNRLSEAGIPFTHKYLKKYNNIVNFYHALDLYIISSRVEGGPMALLESWATSIPLISTPVGMVKDLARPEENILLSSSFSPEEFASLASYLINNSELSSKISKNALKDIQNYSWQKMAESYFQKLYLPFQ